MDTPPSWFGRSVPRLEDAALLHDRGRFVDDIELPDLLHAAFLRSLRPLLTSDRIPLATPSAAIRFDVDPFALARDEVCRGVLGPTFSEGTPGVRSWTSYPGPPPPYVAAGSSTANRKRIHER